jgi:biotin synthase-like enzyme
MNLLYELSKVLSKNTRTATDFINALPSNSFVNTNRGDCRGDCVFCAICSYQKQGAMGSLLQSSCKHASTTMGNIVFLGVRSKELS